MRRFGIFYRFMNINAKKLWVALITDNNTGISMINTSYVFNMCCL